MTSTTRVLVWPAAALVGAVLFLSSAIAVFAASVSQTGGSTPGAVLSVSGTGFQAGEPIQLMLGLSTGSATANGSGSFSGAPVTIPNVPSGTYIVIAVGQQSGLVAFSYLYVSSFFPQGSPSSWWIAPGSTLTWSGSGFAPNESITLARAGTTITTFAADSSGSFSGAGSYVIPFSLRNTTSTFILTGSVSGTQSYLIGVSDLYPSLIPSSYYSAPGGMITLGGSGFAAGEQVVVTIGSATHTATTDNTGAFSLGSVQVPATPNMPATITGVGQSSGASTQFIMAIGQYYPSITPSFWFSYPGDTISFSGSGFAPSETLTISGAGSGTATTDSTGAFSGYSATLPSSNATYTFTGSSSITPFSVTIALGQRVSAIWFDNYWGVGGSALTVFGAGFGNGEQVALAANGNTFATATADSGGSFSHLTTMPFAAPGSLTITATGASTHSTASADTTVAPIWPTLEFGSYAVAPGQTLSIIGSGYLANEPMEVVIDGTVVGTFSTDGSGSFTNNSVVLPTLPEGLHDIVVRGTHSFHSSVITIWVLGS